MVCKVAMSGTGRELRLLDPAIIAGIGSMELRARTIVEGFLAGLHRSPMKGFSVEFAEYRQYLPGDALSMIDWKVYARNDRHYVKKFDAETNVECHVLLDVSASMGYGSRGSTKLDYGSYLAASLSYLMTQQRDSVGFMAFDDHVVNHVRASSRPGQLRAVLLALDQLLLGQQSNLAKPLHLLAESLVKRSVVVIISDLLDDPDKVVRGLKHLRFGGNDVIVFQILDPDELEFPFERATKFHDPESADELIVMPSQVRADYIQAIEELVAKYDRDLKLVNVDYHLVDTSKPLDLSLMHYLSTRSRRG